MNIISQLEADFILNSDKNIAKKQEAYLKNQFTMYGLPTPVRREIQHPFLKKENLPPKENLHTLVTELWNKPQREFLYFSVDLCRKFVKKIEYEDIQLFEMMLTNKSWWDTVDLIATNLVGAYFKLFPEQIIPVTTKWMESGNMWLQRTCLIFQLKYKESIDTKLMSDYILVLKDTNEFFINKAIGWMLREYTRTNPQWVIEFVNTYELSNLSKREALRLINN